MKVLNQICRILTLALGLAAIVLFFFPVATLPATSPVDVTGAQLALGTSIKDAAGNAHNLYVSSYYMFSFVLTAFATILSAVSVVGGFKGKSGKGSIVTAFISSAIAGIIMLVIALSSVAKFVDYRPLTLTTSKVTYTPIVLIAALVILAMFVIGVISWLVNDYVEVLASNGQKLTIKQKVVKFIREMVAEIKKIVWPSKNTVLRNSVIVLIICALLGAFVWVVDYLLGLLVNFITTL